jgi:hypothetical protein
MPWENAWVRARPRCELRIFTQTLIDYSYGLSYEVNQLISMLSELLSDLVAENVILDKNEQVNS